MKAENYVMILLLFLVSCSTTLPCSHSHEKVKVKSISIGIPIEDRYYTYSEESDVFIKHGKVKYLVKSIASYTPEGIIDKLVVYKSDGIIFYNSTEIEKNFKLIDFLSYPKFQNWKVDKKNGLVLKENGDQIPFLLIDDTTVLVYIDKYFFLSIK